MEAWELGMIIGCSVLAVILIAIVVRYLCKSQGGSGSGEKQPLLDGKTTSTAAALRFDKRIESQNLRNQQDQQQQQGGGGDDGMGGAFLDAQATKRINAWVDEVDKFRREGNLIHLSGHPVTSATANSVSASENGSNHSISGGGHAAITSGISTRDSDLLGDTPDVGGMVTPRTPNNLSPRISGVDIEGHQGQSSTQGVYMGYSPKVIP